MADNTEYKDGGIGTSKVLGPITPTHSLDEYPTAFQKHISGGFMHFDTLNDRDALTPLRREQGMVVYVEEDNNFYKLTSGILNDNWEVLVINPIEIIVEDKYYKHDQGVPSSIWNIEHNLNKYPSCTIIDSAGEEVVGSVKFIDNNNIQITFSVAFSGYAVMN
ncbi:MAG: hypothetical protein JXR64_02555 [Spirochaetales bacterium]|nr:hypothetical protein [Spirochaetales bacterium]